MPLFLTIYSVSLFVLALIVIYENNGIKAVLSWLTGPVMLILVFWEKLEDFLYNYKVNKVFTSVSKSPYLSLLKKAIKSSENANFGKKERLKLIFTPTKDLIKNLEGTEIK